MRWYSASCAGLVLSALVGGCVDPPAVVQGRVVSYDAAGKELVLEDEKVPGSAIAFSVEGAEMGAEPQAGDIVRIAYQASTTGRIAGRVMNLTRQAELSGGQTGH